MLINTSELVFWLFDQRWVFEDPFELGSAKRLKLWNKSIASWRARGYSSSISKSYRGRRRRWTCNIFGFEEKRRIERRTVQRWPYHRVQTHTNASIREFPIGFGRILWAKIQFLYQKIQWLNWREETEWIRIKIFFYCLGILRYLGGVWFVVLNNYFQFLNSISRISTYFFTHTYFHKYFQTTIFSF